MTDKTNIKVAITGGIGSGKSFVARMLESRGYDVFHCDAQAKQLMVNDALVREKITEAVGENAYDVYKDDKGGLVWTLNRKVVASFLFDNEKNAKLINRIVHPRLAKVFKRWAAERMKPVVFMEAAVLFEAGFEKLVDWVVVVCADDELRIKRAAVRDNCDKELIQQRVERQMSVEEYVNRADFVIYNNEKDDVGSQIDVFLKKINI